MICFTVTDDLKLKPFLRPAMFPNVALALISKKYVQTAYVGFDAFPGFMPTPEDADMYGWTCGQIRLTDVRPDNMTLSQNYGMLIAFNHSQFYCNRSIGDASRFLDYSDTHMLVVTMPGSLKLTSYAHPVTVIYPKAGKHPTLVRETCITALTMSS